MQMDAPNRKGKIKLLVGRVQSLLKRNGGRMSIARIAFELGYSYSYFRYSILPTIIEATDTIIYDKENMILMLAENDASDDVVELARREARELLERMDQARPEQG